MTCQESMRPTAAMSNTKPATKNRPPIAASFFRAWRTNSWNVFTRRHSSRRQTALSFPAAMNAPHTEEFLTLQEIVAAARRNLAPGPWSYLIGGAETETTVRRNRQALDAIAFRPRVLRDVSRIDSTATFLGRPVRLPVMLAPIGGLESIVQ